MGEVIGEERGRGRRRALIGRTSLRSTRPWDRPAAPASRPRLQPRGGQLHTSIATLRLTFTSPTCSRKTPCPTKRIRKASRGARHRNRQQRRRQHKQPHTMHARTGKPAARRQRHRRVGRQLHHVHRPHTVRRHLDLDQRPRQRRRPATAGFGDGKIGHHLPPARPAPRRPGHNRRRRCRRTGSTSRNGGDQAAGSPQRRRITDLARKFVIRARCEPLSCRQAAAAWRWCRWSSGALGAAGRLHGVRGLRAGGSPPHAARQEREQAKEGRRRFRIAPRAKSRRPVLRTSG